MTKIIFIFSPLIVNSFGCIFQLINAGTYGIKGRIVILSSLFRECLPVYSSFSSLFK